MPHRSRFLVMAILIAATVAIAGCDVASSGGVQPTPTPIPPPPIPVQATYNVQRGEVIDSLAFTGRISPVVQEELYFRVAGRVTRVLVARNDMVEAGQLLAELQNEDLMRQLAQVQIEMDTAELNLQRATEGQQDRLTTLQGQLEIRRLQNTKLRQSLAAMDLEVQLAAIRLAAARGGPSPEDLAIAQSRLERARNALWSDQVRRDAACGSAGVACDQAQAAVNSSEEAVRIEEISLQKLQDGPGEEELLNLRVNHERALQRRREADLDLAIRALEISIAEQEIVRLEEAIDPQLLAAVERARLSVERLQAQVENTQVVSPLTGRLIAVNVIEGQNVDAYDALFIVADEAELEITAEPTADQLRRLAEGMQVQMTLARFPGEPLDGELYQLPHPYGSGGGVALGGAVDRRTRISFDAGDLDLRPGDLVTVDVTIEHKTDVIWLPPAAIRTFAGRSFVVLRDQGVERRVDVVLGIQGIDRVEIEEGLEEGQVVVGQ